MGKLEYKRFEIRRPRARERKVMAPQAADVMERARRISQGPFVTAREIHTLPGFVRLLLRGIAPADISDRELRRFFRTVDDKDADEVILFLWTTAEYVGRRPYDVAVVTREHRGCRPIITRAQGNERR